MLTKLFCRHSNKRWKEESQAAGWTISNGRLCQEFGGIRSFYAAVESYCNLVINVNVAQLPERTNEKPYF